MTSPLGPSALAGGRKRWPADEWRDPLLVVRLSSLGDVILTSGPLPPIPSQLLAARRMDEVIAQLLEQADMVLFDAPPIVAVTDASLLASKVDGVLLVVKANSTRRDHVRAAKDRLDKVNAWLVGSVLLDAPFDRSLGGYYPDYR